MLLSLFKRYGLVVCAAGYTGVLILLHALGRFPAPGPYDLSRLAGAPVLTTEGRVINFPLTRWGKTRFLLEGRAYPLEAFRGRVVVDLDFPMPHLAPDEIIRLRGWMTRPREAGPRRVFNERAYWASQRAYSILHVGSPDALERLKGSDHAAWPQRAWAFHQQFKRFWFQHLPAREAALVSGMTMGTRGVLPPDLKEQCIRAGVYHILVVSGQNMALIIAVGVGLLHLLRIPHRRAFWVCCLPITFYASAVGGDPPVTRASVMAIAVRVVMAAGRDVPGHIPFTLAWLWILLHQPEALFGASFQLSFGATASLLVAFPLLRKLDPVHPRVLRWLLQAGAMSLAVYVGIWPFLAHYFQKISLAGLIANLTLFPWSGCIMVAGLFLGTWGVWSPETVPVVLIDGMDWVLKGTLAAIAHASEWTWAVLPVPPPHWSVCGIYYGLLICILWKLNRAKKQTFL